MSIYAMADFHLSESVDKPMDIFGSAWDNHSERIVKNWPLSDNDVIVIPGDLSWAMDLCELKADIDFLASLPGKKIISKGNHDYWWSSVTKLKAFAKDYDGFYFLISRLGIFIDYIIQSNTSFHAALGQSGNKSLVLPVHIIRFIHRISQQKIKLNSFIFRFRKNIKHYPSAFTAFSSHFYPILSPLLI